MTNTSSSIQVQAIKFVLWVKNMDRAVAFYRDTFGLHQSQITSEWSELTLGTVIVALHGGGAENPVETGLSFQVSDIEAACQLVSTNGGKILESPKINPGEPIKLARLSDPEGNSFMVTEYIGPT